MGSTSHKHPDFLEAREAEGRQDWTVIILGREEIHLTCEELSEVVYQLVKAKAESLDTHPYFSIEVGNDFSKQ